MRSTCISRLILGLVAFTLSGFPPATSGFCRATNPTPVVHSFERIEYSARRGIYDCESAWDTAVTPDPEGRTAHRSEFIASLEQPQAESSC